jgi:hypothetical protein
VYLLPTKKEEEMDDDELRNENLESVEFLKPWKYDPYFRSSVLEIRKADEEDLEYLVPECERCGVKESVDWYIENRITNCMAGDYHLCCKACCEKLGGETG